MTAINPFEHKEDWTKGVHHFLINTDRSVITKNIEGIHAKYNESDEYRQVFDERIIKYYGLDNGDEELFYWRLYKHLVDSSERKEFNARLTEIISEKSKRVESDDDYRVKKIMFYFNNSKNLFKNQMKDIEEGKLEAIRKYNETMDRWNRIEELCKKQNEHYLNLKAELEKNRKDKSLIVDVGWAKLNEDERTNNYNGDFLVYRNSLNDVFDKEYILSHIDHPFIEEAIKKGLDDQQDEAMTKKIIEEITVLINENKLTFLDKARIKSVVERH